MSHYVFFSDAGVLNDKLVRAAKKAVRESGATVLKSAGGSLLVEAAITEVRKVARALPGWKYSAETTTHRIPERSLPASGRRSGLKAPV